LATTSSSAKVITPLVVPTVAAWTPSRTRAPGRPRSIAIPQATASREWLPPILPSREQYLKSSGMLSSFVDGCVEGPSVW
jgi:hypothetical protein